MTSGKWHARIGIATCLIVWAITCLVSWDFKPSGLIIAITLGALLAKFPDLDLDFNLWQGHRNDLFHSSIIPLILLIPVWIYYLPAKALVTVEMKFFYNLGVQFPAYFCIAVSSHLFADLGGAKSHLGHWWWGVHAVISGVAGVAALVMLVV